MTKDEMIEAVLVRLEEFSPYEAPDSFTADATLGGKINPVKSYVEKTLPFAIHDALMMLPLRLLQEDIENVPSVAAIVDADGVGHVVVPSGVVRLCELRFPQWERSVTQTFDRTSPMYDLQQNRYTRGGVAKPVVIWSDMNDNTHKKAEWECYSFPNRTTSAMPTASICKVLRQKDHLEGLRAAEYAVIQCAIRIHGVYGDVGNIKSLRDELQTMLQIDVQ